MTVYPQKPGRALLSRDDLTLKSGSVLEWTVYLGGWGSQSAATLHGKDDAESIVFRVDRPQGNVSCQARIDGFPAEFVGRFEEFEHRCRVELKDGVVKFSVGGKQVGTTRIPEGASFQGITVELSTADERHYGAKQNSSLSSMKLSRGR